MSSAYLRILLCLCLLVTAVAVRPMESRADAFAGLPLLGAPPVEKAGKFSFAILGDKTSGGEGKWPIFDRAVDAINLLAPDFVITVGDQIPGHMEERAPWDAEWAEYLEHAGRLQPPLFLIPGNHDIANIACHAFWKEDFGKTYYSFGHHGCHFLVLNTEEERIDGRGPVWEAMMAFMEADLARHADARHTFVFFHKPMWDDPRYEQAWARLEHALGARPCTVVAGHEHYHMTERRGNMLLVLQSATGGGIHLSDVREYGAFHSFGYVTVDEETMTYAVVEPEGGIWPVDVAPADFRKGIAFEMVKLDGKMQPGTGNGVRLASRVDLHNVLPGAADIEVTVHLADTPGWNPEISSHGPWSCSRGNLVLFEELPPGNTRSHEVAFAIAGEHLFFPPKVSHRVRYRGAWLDNESFPMVQEAVIPIYPADCWRAVPEWRLVGPFSVGLIDTSRLPGEPEQANARFFEPFGPEEGYDPDRAYAGGLRWFDAPNQGRGLLNFNALMGTLDHALGYALCAIHTPEPRTTHALAYSDNYHQGVLNGELIAQGQDFGAPSGFTCIPLELRAGWNTFIMKLFNNRGDWFLRVLVADPHGNLTFAPSPPAP